jgi:hypothetical protein
MSDRTDRTEALHLINRIKNPHLSFNKFTNAPQLYDVKRRPYSTLPTETKDAIEREIDLIIATLDEALAKLTSETFQSVLNLHQMKASSFNGQAFVRRFLRGSGSPEDYVHLSKYLADLRQALTMQY